jgi:hypothetical protein
VSINIPVEKKSEQSKMYALQQDTRCVFKIPESKKERKKKGKEKKNRVFLRIYY